jgi:hypothetical protein
MKHINLWISSNETYGSITAARYRRIKFREAARPTQGL